MTNLNHLVPTIIIIVEVHAELRGYPLLGREFLLKKKTPVRETALMLDGQKVESEFWVVSKDEYMRVVPEARVKDFDSDEILIPTWVAQFSFRPVYSKNTHIKF